MPAGGMPKGKWGKMIDYNLFATSDADRNKFAAHGCDAHSLVGDPLFVDPASKTISSSCPKAVTLSASSYQPVSARYGAS